MACNPYYRWDLSTEKTGGGKMKMKKVTRRNFLRVAASSAAAITATMLVGCDDGGSGNSTASNGSYKPGGTGSSEKTENPVEKPADSNESEGSSFIVKGTVIRSKEYKTEVETRVDFYIGGTTLRVVDERKIISVVDGRTYTDVNPTARITIQVGVIKLNMTRGVTAINRKLPLAHAEVGAMYQALMAGEGDAPARLYVTGSLYAFSVELM